MTRTIAWMCTLVVTAGGFPAAGQVDGDHDRPGSVSLGFAHPDVRWSDASPRSSGILTAAIRFTARPTWDVHVEAAWAFHPAAVRGGATQLSNPRVGVLHRRSPDSPWIWSSGVRFAVGADPNAAAPEAGWLGYGAEMDRPEVWDADLRFALDLGAARMWRTSARTDLRIGAKWVVASMAHTASTHAIRVQTGLGTGLGRLRLDAGTASSLNLTSGVTLPDHVHYLDLGLAAPSIPMRPRLELRLPIGDAARWELRYRAGLRVTL